MCAAFCGTLSFRKIADCKKIFQNKRHIVILIFKVSSGDIYYYSRHFLSYAQLINLFRTIKHRCFLQWYGICYMTCGSIDLSAGGILASLGYLCGYTMVMWNWNLVLAILLSLAVSALVRCGQWFPDCKVEILHYDCHSGCSV